MSQINYVTVRVSDGKKTEDYGAPRIYDLTANVVLAEGDDVDVAIAHAMRTLSAHGNTFLNGKAAAAPKAAAPKAEEKKPEPVAEPKPEPVAEPKPEPAKDNDLGDILGNSAPVAEINDDELVHAVMKRNEALKDGTKIRSLVETYNPQPGLRVFKATEISQKDRPGFLEKLAAL